ncbi:MAG: hypothetical protein E6J87_23530 [Deltaproteobacteria bacterium]|nr:MAG: hypothetical protein E6J87_23530 [Deltaproteobacteria bacterium]
MRDRDENEWLEHLRAEYRSAGSSRDATSRERLLERLAHESAPRRRANPFGWLARQPLSVQGAVACAALVLAAAGGIGALRRLDRDAMRGSPVPPAPVLGVHAGFPGTITFALRAPQVTTVALVGDFNSWDPRATPMRRQGQGDLWTTQVELSDGLHSYAYVIDGADWQPDPGAPLSAEAPFGRRSSIIVVGEQGSF